MPTVLEIQCQLKERGLFKGTSGLKKAQLQDILTNGKTPKAEKSKKEEPKKEEPKKREASNFKKNYFYELPQELQNEIQSKNVKDINIFVTDERIVHGKVVRSYKIASIGNAFRSINGKVFWVGIKNIVEKKMGKIGAPYRVVVNEFKSPRAIPSNFRFYKMHDADGRQFTMGYDKGFENFPITEFNKLQEKSIEPVMTKHNYFSPYNMRNKKGL